MEQEALREVEEAARFSGDLPTHDGVRQSSQHDQAPFKRKRRSCVFFMESNGKFDVKMVEAPAK
jgi:hypothetical protein